MFRFVCTKHHVDLDYATNRDGNPDNVLFAIRYDRAREAGPVGHFFNYDVEIAKKHGILDGEGNVLKPGLWYVWDLSHFQCPKNPVLTVWEGREPTEEEIMRADDNDCAQWHAVVDELGAPVYMDPESIHDTWRWTSE